MYILRFPSQHWETSSTKENTIEYKLNLNFAQSFDFQILQIHTCKACNYFVPSLLLPWLSLAAAATEAATPVGWVVRYGSFRISAPVTPSASRRVAGLSAGNFEVASYKLLQRAHMFNLGMINRHGQKKLHAY